MAAMLTAFSGRVFFKNFNSYIIVHVPAWNTHKFKDEYLSAKLICEETVFAFYHPIACRIYSALPTYCVLN